MSRGRPRKQANDKGQWFCTKRKHWLPLSEFYADPLKPDRPSNSWCKKCMKQHRDKSAVNGALRLLHLHSLREWEALSEEERARHMLTLSDTQIAKLQRLGFNIREEAA